MALALYRKYRPATFAEVVGQEHVTKPLSAALRSGRINHAYLFSGPRGCGKTSSARILARSLNCERGPTDTPCGECDSCVNLAPNGKGSIDVIELDAASHGGVDDARELRDRAFYAPAESRYRVFIIDEAHMVTTQGFNALLKIVEEPPEHLVFVFATTEPEKVLTTIRSRTHHYPFRLIPPGAMRELLERNCEAEGVTVEQAVFPLVVKAGGGSARDTQSVLDQLLAGAGPGGVTYDLAVGMLGVTDVGLLDEMVGALADSDGAAAFGCVDRLVEAGHDPRRFATDLLERFRDLVLLRAVTDAAEKGLVSAPDDELAVMTSQAKRLGPAALTRFAEILHDGLTDMRGTTAPRLQLELLCARMLLPAASTDESALLHRLERLERGTPASHPGPAQPRVTAQRPAEVGQQPAPVLPPAAPAAADDATETVDDTPEPNGDTELAVAGTTGTDNVRSAWQEVLAAVRGQSRSVQAMLSAATVQAVHGDEVVLSHPAEPLVRRLSEPRNVETVAGALHSVLDGQWQVRWVHAGAAEMPASRPAQPPQRATAPSEPEEPPAAVEPPPSAPEPEPRPDVAQEPTPEDPLTLLQEQLGAKQIDEQ